MATFVEHIPLLQVVQAFGPVPGHLIDLLGKHCYCGWYLTHAHSNNVSKPDDQYRKVVRLNLTLPLRAEKLANFTHASNAQISVHVLTGPENDSTEDHAALGHWCVQEVHHSSHSLYSTAASGNSILRSLYASHGIQSAC